MRLALLLLGSAAPLLAQPNPRQPAAVLPVLEFPERGVGDSSSYRDYRTRLYRDASGNTVQIYLDGRAGRVVHLWADAANESVGFTVRDASGRPVPLAWGAREARVTTDTGVSPASRVLSWRLTTRAPAVTIGWILLGSMRVERDLQYARRHLQPYGVFGLPELDSAIAAMSRLPAAERTRHLVAMNAPTVESLRARLDPVPVVAVDGDSSVVRIAGQSLDARNRLVLELRVATAEVNARVRGRTVSLRARRTGVPLAMTVRIATDAAPLTPLGRRDIFTDEFLAYAARARGADSAFLERRIRAVELLASREKLMAGLPNFATYFGRDMLMTALMMASVWKPAMSEHVIASVLRKLGPAGDVSHEEALGGQAVREAVAEYASLLRAWERTRADSLLVRARDVIGNVQRVRENYHMIDDELQFPVLVARWLGDPRVPDDRKRAFLLEREPGAPATRLVLLAKALELVAGQAMPYARDPSATNLRGFARLDSARWRSSSWRDSDAGYANGRFAMDVNVVWMPLALRSMGDILSVLDRLGLVRAGAGDVVTLAGTTAAPDSTLPGTLLSRFLRFPDSLRQAHRTWTGSVRHFVVALGPEQVRSRVRGRLATLPAPERHYWERVVATTRADRDSLVFLALSLDASGRPIGVASTDVGMRMLLATAPMPPDSAARADVLRDLDVLMRPFPVGLFVDTLGPVVANDAYAPAAVWSRFERDRYHSPRVVWGREVNVIEMAMAAAIEQALDASGVLRAGVPASYVATLRSALERTRRAVRASGFAEAELWSYRIEGRRLRPTRFGSASDVQLWNTTSLAVEYVLDQISR